MHTHVSRLTFMPYIIKTLSLDKWNFWNIKSELIHYEIWFNSIQSFIGEYRQHNYIAIYEVEEYVLNKSK